MADYVAVANLAMQKLGANDRISAPDQDSDVARTIAAAWDIVRERTIRGGKHAPKWNFALRYADVPARAPSASNPLPYGWTSAFPFPDRCLRVVEIVRPEAAIRFWKVANNEILTSTAGPLGLWYLIDVEEISLWDALFVDTFAARLAYQTADRITGDMGRKFACRDEWVANLIDAAGVDAGEDPPVEPDESDWVLARYQR